MRIYYLSVINSICLNQKTPIVKMEIDLSKMTTDELGELFPIIIVDYNPDWPKLALIESKKIIKIVGKSQCLED